MDSKKIIEQAILKTSLNFQLIDYIEEQIEKGNKEAENLINSFFETKKSFQYNYTAPLICLESTLGIMASVIFFANSKNVIISNETKKYLEEKNYSNQEILKIIRNAIAHWADNNHKNIQFFEDKIKFNSRQKSVTMSLPNGLHLFVMDMIKETRNLMRT